ncbi:Stk1 family PASTA domain-containing Ser/Thr kinase [Bifidobacterium gallicum]|nr:Stk1 family PASTA domain-containing Ser/Thr kinase [Bifidobacterium gallicum]
MTESPNVQEGTVIDGRYRIITKIAEGGMASVFKATDERLGRTVAIKVMHMQLAKGPKRAQFVERFRREATSAAAIANAHIVQVYDSGEFNDLDFLVMEYVQGVNLRQDMQLHGTYSVRDTLRIVGETLDGLAAAHRAGVVHRDIKPENIMLNQRGRVQITDFGLAKAVSQATLSTTGMLLGTAAYLAPEMIAENQATAQGDCYSVGIMAWEMLTGEVPFKSDNPVTLVFKHVNNDVPPVASVCAGIAPEVSQFISYLTARKVEDRPVDAAAALQRLRALMGELTSQQLSYRYDPTRAHTMPLVGLDGLASGRFVHADVLQHSTSEASDGTAAMSATSHATAAAPDPSPAEPEDPTKAMPIAAAPDAVAAEQPLPATTAMPQQHGGEEPTVSLPMPPHGNTNTANNEPKPRKRKGGLIALIIVLVVLLVCGSAGGVAYYVWLGPGSYRTLPQPEGLKCPTDGPCTITGVSWKDYQQQLKAVGIAWTASEEFSDTVAQGDIIATVPADVDGHIAKKDGKVKVVVSKGVRQATVPADIMDANSEAGKHPVDALKQAGFTNVQEDEAQYSMDVPEGAVISIDPKPDETVPHSTPVTITLSKGRMPVTMPSVVGKPIDQAREALAAVKLNVTVNEEFSDTVEAGQVMTQSVAADTQLHWGDNVSISVSKGPQMVTIPNVVGDNKDDATKKLEELGLQVKITAPLGDLLHTVRFQNPGAGEQVRLHDENGNPTVVTLTVI